MMTHEFIRRHAVQRDQVWAFLTDYLMISMIGSAAGQGQESGQGRENG